MADRIKLRRGSKSKIDLNVYELGYVTDPNEQRLYFNNGSIVPIPNNKDITDIKTELTKTTNISNKNKQDISYLKDSIDGISATGSVRLVQHSYDISLSGSTKKVNIPYEMYSSATDTLKVYVNGLAIQNDQYTITDPVEHDGTVTKGYIMLEIERPAGTIVRIEVWKNVPCGEEGAVSGNIIARNSLPLDRIIGLNDNMNNYEVAGGTATAITLNMPATLKDGYWKKFIASGDNGGTPTTINGKSVYKVSTTNPPRFKKDRPYEVYYNAAKNCFFLKASATGTTSADKVLAGETFSTENDTDLVGTMPNKGAVTQSLSANGSLTLPRGYYDSIKVTQSLTTKGATTWTPKTTDQTIASGTYLTGTQTIKGDSNLISSNIKEGASIFGVNGSYKFGTNLVKSGTLTVAGDGQPGELALNRFYLIQTTHVNNGTNYTSIIHTKDGVNSRVQIFERKDNKSYTDVLYLMDGADSGCYTNSYGVYYDWFNNRLAMGKGNSSSNGLKFNYKIYDVTDTNMWRFLGFV